MPVPTVPTAPTVLKASDYPSRDSLEKYIESVFGATPEPKDAIIEGTDAELLKHYLSHGDTVWGVLVSSKDYKPKVNVPRVERGEIFKTKLNGLPI